MHILVKRTQNYGLFIDVTVTYIIYLPVVQSMSMQPGLHPHMLLHLEAAVLRHIQDQQGQIA